MNINWTQKLFHVPCHFRQIPAAVCQIFGATYRYVPRAQKAQLRGSFLGCQNLLRLTFRKTSSRFGGIICNLNDRTFAEKQATPPRPRSRALPPRDRCLHHQQDQARTKQATGAKETSTATVTGIVMQNLLLRGPKFIIEGVQDVHQVTLNYFLVTTPLLLAPRRSTQILQKRPATT